MVNFNKGAGVLLDFIDGSTLQCACEHPQGQAGVLQGNIPLATFASPGLQLTMLAALRQAHSAWQSQ